MVGLVREEKIHKLRDELKGLEVRLAETLKKSNEAFNLGGDGWHDNSAYHLMISEVDKLGALIDQIREELQDLQRNKVGS